MGIKDNEFSVKVIDNVVIHAEEPWTDHWLPLTNLDLLVPPFDVGSFFCYKKPSHGNFSDILNNLKLSLSRALSLYYPLAGDIKWNEAAKENQFHCNNQGVDFTEAFADMELKELNFYNPDESIEGKLIPKRLRGVLAIQVTELKCGAIVIGSMFDHRSADGYTANIFMSSWADLARSETPSMLPSFERSILSPRCPTTYSSSIDDIFSLFEPPTKPDDNQNHDDGEFSVISRIYFIDGEQLENLQQLASENGCRRSKLEAFTSFLWKIVALSMETSENHNKMCNVALSVDGRSRLGQGDGEEKQKLMASHFGNVLTMPSGSKSLQDLMEMSLSNIAKEVHEFVQTAARKEHFLDLIDWVEDRQKLPLVAKAFAGKDMAVMISSGQRFQIMDKMDFGWGKVAFGSCHVPSARQDNYDLMEMSLSNIAKEVHEFVQTAARKEHFLDLIDWVEDRRKLPLVAKAFAGKDMAVMISSGQRFQIMDKMDFGWGKVAFGSCHVPSARQDNYVMTLPSPTNYGDWIVYMHLPMKHLNYIEAHANQMFKPLNADYLQI